MGLRVVGRAGLSGMNVGQQLRHLVLKLTLLIDRQVMYTLATKAISEKSDTDSQK